MEMNDTVCDVETNEVGVKRKLMTDAFITMGRSIGAEPEEAIDALCALLTAALVTQEKYEIEFSISNFKTKITIETTEM